MVGVGLDKGRLGKRPTASLYLFVRRTQPLVAESSALYTGTPMPFARRLRTVSGSRSRGCDPICREKGDMPVCESGRKPKMAGIGGLEQGRQW